MFHAELAACKDPVVRLVKAQNVALDLLSLGLRPKQVVLITELSIKRVNQIREGLILSAADRAARPPMSAATILRQAELRAASSFFFSVYQRVMAVSDVTSDLTGLSFHEAYEIYAHQSTIVAKGQGEVLPILPIEDAWTLIMALEQGQLEAVLCEEHDTHYLTITRSSSNLALPLLHARRSKEAIERSAHARCRCPHRTRFRHPCGQHR